MIDRDTNYRPRTSPIIGSYDTSQLDDFHDALARCEVTTAGVMHYVQRMLIADACEHRAHVVDIGCGHGLQLPMLYQYAPFISSYTGLDIAPGNLAQAGERIAVLDAQHGNRPCHIELMECDVSAPWLTDGPFDIAIYTSTLERLPREQGIASLHHTAQHLTGDGILFLSTPNTPRHAPRMRQHTASGYEWHHTELLPILREIGLEVHDRIGLVPPEPVKITRGLTQRYGTAAHRWHTRLSAIIPSPFLDIIEAAALPDLASEILYICGRR